MTILHVTDFHFNKRWFDWLLHRAPPHDLAVMSGDMLDLAGATPHHNQIAWVTAWLNHYPRPMCVCSGNHDLEWHDRMERWTPAYWLRYLSNPNVWRDGQRVELDGVSLINIGCSMRPKGAEADIWVVHAPPSKTLVAARADGTDGGDPDLVEPARRYAPKLVLSGHVHNPLHWRERSDTTLFLNPGYNADAAFPNHIVVNTEQMNSHFHSDQSAPAAVESHSMPQSSEAEKTGVVTAAV